MKRGGRVEMKMMIVKIKGDERESSREVQKSVIEGL